MSYQVIARKWRPKSFDELVGQSHVSQTLLNALRGDRLPHALLFTGPRGTGKTSSARILAKALRCPQAQDFIPCNSCSECIDISEGRSIDVIEIDGASNNGVEAVRELRDTVGYMPSSGKYKLYIIDEVHMLSTSAFNALLKTLEEPPAHVVFVMATTEVHKIPNTILSRCQRFDFRRIPLRRIADQLQHICKTEGIRVDENALWMVARQGDGSMRDSQSLLDQVITFCQGDITLQKVIEILGLTDRALLTNTVSALINRDSQALMGIVEKVSIAGLDPKVFIQDLLEELRHLLIIKMTPHKDRSQLVDLPQAEIELLERLAQNFSEEDIQLLFDMALKGGNDIPRSQEPRIILEMLLLRMGAAPRIRSLRKVLEDAPSLEPEATPKAERPHRSSASAETEAPKAPQGTSSEKWLSLVSQIQKVNGVFAAQLEHTFLKEEQGQNLIIGIPQKMKFLHKQLDNTDFKNKLSNYIQTFWGSGYQVAIQMVADQATSARPGEDLSPRALSEKKRLDHEQAVRHQVENHPFIKTTQNILKTQIKTIKELR